MNIRINQEYIGLVPEISVEEYEALKQSLRENGQYVPIIVNQHGVLLDGHHRYKACPELGIEASHMVRKFTDELDEKLFVIDCNLTRRQLNNFQRTELALRSKPILEAVAKRNESLGGKGVRFLTPLGRVDKMIGERAGVSHDTVRKVEKIIEFFPEDGEELDKLRGGEISVNRAYERILHYEETQQQEQHPSMEKETKEIPPELKELESCPNDEDVQQEKSEGEVVAHYVKDLHITDTLITDNITFLLEKLTNLDVAKAEKISSKELPENTENHMLEMIKRWSIEQAEITLKTSYPLPVLLRKFNEMLETELANKLRNREMFSV